MERHGQCSFMDIGHALIYAYEDNEYIHGSAAVTGINKITTIL